MWRESKRERERHDFTKDVCCCLTICGENERDAATEDVCCCWTICGEREMRERERDSATEDLCCCWTICGERARESVATKDMWKERNRER